MQTDTDIENEDAPLVPDVRRDSSRTTRTPPTTGRGDPYEFALQEQTE